MRQSLNIAMLAHSTNPRGGVVHALQLSEALVAMGHRVTLHAPDPKGRGFFRKPSCDAVSIPAGRAPDDLRSMVVQRIAEYVRYFERNAPERFDIFHAHDGISGNALATLKERGLISGFVRTVHHIDTFTDPEVMGLQDRSIHLADAHFTVSRYWQSELQNRGLKAVTVGNGVDLRRFKPETGHQDSVVKARFGIGKGPVFLSVGGVEERKNTQHLLHAFIQVRTMHREAQLVIAGGASLLDHTLYQSDFKRDLAAAELPANAVVSTGPVADDDMVALYRLADTLVFPSTKEGFGLVVLEAMACGTPVVTSAISPFTEYLADGDVVWCDPSNMGSIANAMLGSLEPSMRQHLVRAGHAVAERHDWRSVAGAHIQTYEAHREAAYA